MAHDFCVGDKVWWTDPYDEACSGKGIVIEALTESVYTVKLIDFGEEIQASPRELTPLFSWTDSYDYESDCTLLETDDGYWWFEGEDYYAY